MSLVTGVLGNLASQKLYKHASVSLLQGYCTYFKMCTFCCNCFGIRWDYELSSYYKIQFVHLSFAFINLLMASAVNVILAAKKC
jgi:hypothetical protein